MSKCKSCGTEYIGEVPNPCRICGPKLVVKNVKRDKNVPKTKEK